MAKKKIHFAGKDPWEGTEYGPTVWRYLGCANPKSETAVSVHKDSDTVTTDPALVTCCHCRVRIAAKG